MGQTLQPLRPVISHNPPRMQTTRQQQDSMASRQLLLGAGIRIWGLREVRTTMRATRIRAPRIAGISRIRRKRRRTRRRIRRSLAPGKGTTRGSQGLLSSKDSMTIRSKRRKTRNSLTKISPLSRTRLVRAFSKIKTPARMRGCRTTRSEVIILCTLVRSFSIDT